jgi:hypothetical protein
MHTIILVPQFLKRRNRGGRARSEDFGQFPTPVGFHHFIYVDLSFFNGEPLFPEHLDHTVARNTFQNGSLFQRGRNDRFTEHKENIHRAHFLQPFMFKCICPQHLVIPFGPGFCRGF